MKLIEAANAPSLVEAARIYADLGFSLVPLRGKKPSMGWDDMKARPASIPQIEYWDSIGALHNIGIVAGAVSRGLVVVDCDGIEAILKFKAAFPDFAHNTFTVLTGSGKGAHYYFFTSIIPPTTRVTGEAWGNIELRAEGCYHVAPPSIHPDTGRYYRVGRELPINRVSSLRDIVDWLNSLRPSQQATRSASAGGGIVNGSKYGAAALAGECAAVRSATEGGQNSRLYRAALKLGSLIADKRLGRYEVESALMCAARDCGYVARDGESAAWKTINSGLNVGMESSREAFKR